MEDSIVNSLYRIFVVELIIVIDKLTSDSYTTAIFATAVIFISSFLFILTILIFSRYQAIQIIRNYSNNMCHSRTAVSNTLATSHMWLMDIYFVAIQSFL